MYASEIKGYIFKMLKFCAFLSCKDRFISRQYKLADSRNLKTSSVLLMYVVALTLRQMVSHIIICCLSHKTFMPKSSYILIYRLRRNNIIMIIFDAVNFHSHLLA